MSNSKNALSLKIPCEDVEDMRKRYLKTMLGTTNITLTDKEFEILYDIVRHCKGLVSTDSRKDICKRLEITMANLNNNLGRLSQKGLFTTIDGKVTVYPVLLFNLSAFTEVFITFTRPESV